MLKISAFLFNTSVDLHESRTTHYLASVVIELNLVYVGKVV